MSEWIDKQAAFLAKMPYALAYDDEKHKYTVDGVVYPSVNQIIDKVLGREYKGDPIYGEIGTASMKAVELHLRGELDEDTLDGYTKPRLDAFKAFEQETGFSPIACEMPLYAEGICGRFDLLGRIDGKEWLIDVKCVKNLNRFTNKLQLSGYWKLVMNNGVAAPNLAALQLRDDGTHHFEPYEVDADALWQSVMILYREKTK